MGMQRVTCPRPQSSGATNMRREGIGQKYERQPASANGSMELTPTQFVLHPELTSYLCGMGKNKLRRFEENKSFPHLLQPGAPFPFSDHPVKGKWNATFFVRSQPLVLE